MTPGERRSSPSTSVAQQQAGRASLTLLHRESRRQLLMHMAHMGMWFMKRS